MDIVNWFLGRSELPHTAGAERNKFVDSGILCPAPNKLHFILQRTFIASLGQSSQSKQRIRSVAEDCSRGSYILVLSPIMSSLVSSWLETRNFQVQEEG